jgi:hypothetical protein
MPTFKKRIAISEGFNPEFLFNRIYTVSGVHYFISVMDKAHKTLNFSMQECDGSWKVMDVPTPPQWVSQAEEALEQAIFEYLSQ